MATRNVGFRLGTDGKAEVKNDFAEVRAAGTAAMVGVADAAEDAADRAAQATERYTERQLESYRKQAAAAKLAAAGADTRSSFDDALALRGTPSQTATVNLDRSTGAARESAAVFEQAARAADEQAASVAKLRAAIDPLYLARVRYDDELRTANSLVSQGAITETEHAARLKQSAAAYREVADAAGVAAERQRAAWSAEATAARTEMAGQSRFSQVGSTVTGKSARESAELFEAEGQRADSLAKIRAMIDPLAVAQARYDAELRTYNSLLGPTGLNEREHAAAVAVSTQRLEEARRAVDGHSESVGFNRVQMMMLRSAAFNASSSIAAGMPLYRVLIEQGLEVGQALSMGDDSAAGGMKKLGSATREAGGEIQQGSEQASGALDTLKEKGKEAAGKLTEENGVAGALGKVRAILTPTRLAIGATAAALAIGAKSWLDYTDAVHKLNVIGEGAGRIVGMTGDELEATAESAARAGDMSVSAAREIETAYVQSGNVTKEVLGGLVAITKDFAAATGQDVPAATSALDAAMGDPIQGAQDLAERYGWINQATAEYIGKLVEQNDETGAQRVLMDAVAKATEGAADKANALARGWDNIKIAAAGAWTWLGKAIDRAAGGGAIADQIADLQRKRAQGPSVGQLLTGTSRADYEAGIDKEIAGLRQQLRTQQVQADRASANKAQAEGAAIVSRYQGDERDGYRTTVGKLRAALATDMPPEQRAELTKTLDAYSHAIDTFIPRAERANQVAAIDAKIAAAKTPAAKAALTAEKARLELAGQVITSADAEAQANARGERARSSTRVSRDRHGEALAREAASMEASARGALDVADAYLKSSAAGVQAEARRKALTDATRRGIDVDAQVRRQLNLQVAEGVAAGAKSIAEMRDETAARTAVVDQVRDGTISVADMSRALSDEAALRPLIKLRTIAQGDALIALNRVIDEYRASLDKAHVSEDAFGLTKAIEASIDRAEELKAVVADLKLQPLDQALNAAKRAANRDADDLHLGADSDGRKELVRKREDEARQSYLADRSRYITDALRDQADGLALAQRELELVGASDDVRSVELEKLRIALEIRRKFPDMDQADIDARMRGVEAQDRINARLKVTAAALDEVRGFGSQLADDVLDPDKWSSWGAMGKSVLNDIKQEFIKLALLNPLKNLINGNSAAPTLGSLFGNIGKLFGGGTTLAGGIAGPASLVSTSAASFAPIALPRLATGTEYASGGATWVGENGPEIVDLPRGSRVTPAGESRLVAAANDDRRGGDTHHWHLEGAVVTQDLLDQMNAIGAGAAVRGAAGGAQMAGRDSARAARRSLVRR